MGVQTITTAAGERLVVLSENEYEALVEAADENAAAEAIRRFEQKLAAGEEEFIPSEWVDRMPEGESRVLIWREYRGITLDDLARKANITTAELSDIECGKEGSLGTMKKIAEALKVTIDDLV
jgi:DNA-binding Xre family transcriptional regulator